MSLFDTYFKNTPRISIEFTSPCNPVAEKYIMNCADNIHHFDTDFSCVNFGGNFMSPERAMMITERLKNTYQMPVWGYLRRSNIDRTEFDKIALEYKKSNINSIFLTEGRRLNTTNMSVHHYETLYDAVCSLKQKHDFKIAIEARTEHDSSEIDVIKRLIDVGVDEIVTRFSFNPHNVLRFIDKLGNQATRPKIRIGILPIENPSQTFLTAHLLNVPVSDTIHKLFENYTDNQPINLCLGTHIMLSQIQGFMQEGYHDFHIRFGRLFEPIETVCRYYGIAYHNPQQATQTNIVKKQAVTF
jgi:5,10-methylenetetrahydrofolate reductase